MDRSHSAAPRIASARATHIAVNAESPVWGVAVLLCVLVVPAFPLPPDELVPLALPSLLPSAPPPSVELGAS